jgi:hypothetical protein
MSRLFDGTDDLMAYTVPAGVALNDALTLLIVCRIMTATDTSWLSLLEGKSSGGSIACAMGRRNTGDMYFANTAGSTFHVGQAVGDGDNWTILAIRRTAAAATSADKALIAGARSTVAGGALADGLTMASGTLRIGGNADFANIRVAAAAAFTSDIGTAGFDAVLSAKTTASIAALTPFWLVDDSDAFATNLINPGVMDRSAIVGTADDGDDPSGWVYGLGGGGDPPDPNCYLMTAGGLEPCVSRVKTASGLFPPVA